MEDLKLKYDNQYFEDFVKKNVRSGNKNGSVMKLRIKKNKILKKIKELESSVVLDAGQAKKISERVKKLKMLNLHYLILDSKKKKKIDESTKGIDQILKYFQENSTNYRMLMPACYNRLSRKIQRDVKPENRELFTNSYQSRVRKQAQRLLLRKKGTITPFNLKKDLGEKDTNDQDDNMSRKEQQGREASIMLQYSTKKINSILFDRRNEEKPRTAMNCSILNEGALLGSIEETDSIRKDFQQDYVLEVGRKETLGEQKQGEGEKEVNISSKYASLDKDVMLNTSLMAKKDKSSRRELPQIKSAIGLRKSSKFLSIERPQKGKVHFSTRVHLAPIKSTRKLSTPQKDSHTGNGLLSPPKTSKYSKFNQSIVSLNSQIGELSFDLNNKNLLKKRKNKLARTINRIDKVTSMYSDLDHFLKNLENPISNQAIVQSIASVKFPFEIY